MTIYAVSDLHTDIRENLKLIEAISPTQHKRDSVIVAGDISNRLDVIEKTLHLLKAKFKHVFFVPGNHELWVAKEGHSSLDKFDQIVSLCQELRIYTVPKLVEGVWVVPLFSWYERAFYPEGDHRAPELEAWGDFHLCQWPMQIDHSLFDPCKYFIGLNGWKIKAYDRPVISFSHFVPRLDLLPPPHVLTYKSLPLVSGSAKIEEIIRSIDSKTHIFGHTHINVDTTIEGVRYVQNAMRYPRERRRLEEMGYGEYGTFRLEQVWPLKQSADLLPWEHIKSDPR